MVKKEKCGACGSDSAELVDAIYATRTKFRVKPSVARLCKFCARRHHRIMFGG